MSSVTEDPGLIDRTARTLQVIVGAMVAGLLVFLAVVLIMPPGAPPRPPAPAPGPTEPLPALTVAAYTFAVIFVPLSLVVPKLISDGLRKRIAAGTWSRGAPQPATDLGGLASVYQTRAILGAALNEGPAFFALIAYMIERNNVALGLALALIAGVAVRFPRRAAVEQWLDGQLAQLQAERQGAKFP